MSRPWYETLHRDNRLAYKHHVKSERLMQLSFRYDERGRPDVGYARAKQAMKEEQVAIKFGWRKRR